MDDLYDLLDRIMLGLKTIPKAEGMFLAGEQLRDGNMRWVIAAETQRKLCHD